MNNEDNRIWSTISDVDRHLLDLDVRIGRLSKKPYPDIYDREELTTLLHDRDQIIKERDKFLDDAGLLEAYYQRKGLNKPEPPKEEPGFLGKLLGAGTRAVSETVGDIAKSPVAAAATFGEGAAGLATLPARAVRGLGKMISPEHKPPALDPIEMLIKGGEKVAEGAEYLRKQSGISPESYGTPVLKAAGSVALPAGPALKAGEHLKNILKSAGVGAGYTAGEAVAEGRMPSGEELGLGGGAGGLMGALISALMPKAKIKPPATKPPEAPKAPEGVIDLPPAEGAIKESSLSPGEQLSLLELLKMKGAPDLKVKLEQKLPPPKTEISPEAAYALELEKAKIEPLEATQKRLPFQRPSTKFPSSPEGGGEALVSSERDALNELLGLESFGKVAKPSAPKPEVAPPKHASKPVEPKERGIPLERQLRVEGYKLNTDPKTGEIVVLRPPDLKEEFRFNPKDPQSRAKAVKFFEEERGPFYGEEGKTIKLHSGVDLSEVPEALRSVGGDISRVLNKATKKLQEIGSSLLEPASSKDKLSPLTRSLKVPAAMARVGGPQARILFEARAMEDAVKVRVNNLRYRDLPQEQRFVPTDYELYDRAPREVKDKINAVWRKYERLGVRPTPEEMAADGLTPGEQRLLMGVQEAFDKAYEDLTDHLIKMAAIKLGKKGVTPKDLAKYVSEELSESEREVLSELIKASPASEARIAEIPKEARSKLKEVLGVELGRKVMYYPHRWLGNFEIWRVDVDGNPVNKILAPVKGLEPEEGRSSFSTRFIAELYRKEASKTLGIPLEYLKVVDRRQPGFRRHLEKRLDATGYEQQRMDQVTRDYFYELYGFIERNKFSHLFKELLKDPEMGPNDKLFLERWAGRVLGEKAKFDLALDYIASKVPILNNIMSPYEPYTQAMSGIRKFATHKALGLGNIAAALLNADALTRHVTPGLARLQNQLGVQGLFKPERYVVDALKRWLSNLVQVAFKDSRYEDVVADVLEKALGSSRENRYLVQKLAHYAVSDIQILGEPLPATHNTVSALERASLAAFTTTEDLTRTTAAIAAYRMARDAGLNEAQALEQASRFVAEAVGRYTQAGKPFVYTSEFGKTVGLFKTYLHVMIDNAFINTRHPIKDFGAFSRYMLATTAVAGLMGIPEAKGLSRLVELATDENPLDWANRHLPLWLVRGGLAELGLDLSGRAGLSDIMPESAEDLAGPAWSSVLKPAGQIAGDLFRAAAATSRGEPLTFSKDFAEHLELAMPNTIGFKYLKHVVDGNLYDTKGHLLLRDLSPQEQILEFLGLPYTRKVETQRLIEMESRKVRDREERASRYVKKWLDGELSPEEWQRVKSKYHITQRMVEGERERRRKESLPRRLEHIPKHIRREVKEEARASGAMP